MHYLADYGRYVIVERNEGIGREVQMLRLESRLREKGGPRPGSRLAFLVSKGTLPLLTRAGIAGWRRR